MHILPIPDIMLADVFELKPETLKEKGVTLLLMDLDNTLGDYHAKAPTDRLRLWIEELKSAGVEPFIYSNSHGEKAASFAEALGLEYINRAQKPAVGKLFRLLRAKGIRPENTAIIGDQIYTDVLCGKRAGILTIATRPLDLSNPLYDLRFRAEAPFRAAYRRRIKKTEKKD